MTRIEYNDKVVEILCNKQQIQTKPHTRRHLKQKLNLRRSTRAYGKHDKVSTRSSKRSIHVSKAEIGSTIHGNPKLRSKKAQIENMIHENPIQQPESVKNTHKNNMSNNNRANKINKGRNPMKLWEILMFGTGVGIINSGGMLNSLEPLI